MGSHPLNLALRFLLELAVLFISVAWGWSQSNSWFRFVLAFGIPLILAGIWGIFAVPNDPSRSGHAPVPTPGLIRLVIELTFFALGAWGLYDLGYITQSWVFGGIVIAHYLASYDRIQWLMAQKGN